MVKFLSHDREFNSIAAWDEYQKITALPAYGTEVTIEYDSSYADGPQSRTGEIAQYASDGAYLYHVHIKTSDGDDVVRISAHDQVTNLEGRTIRELKSLSLSDDAKPVEPEELKPFASQ